MAFNNMYLYKYLLSSSLFIELLNFFDSLSTGVAGNFSCEIGNPSGLHGTNTPQVTLGSQSQFMINDAIWATSE